jgi:hypothetical protein
MKRSNVDSFSFISEVYKNMKKSKSNLDKKEREFNEEWEKTYRPSKKKRSLLP